jgi:hypothetical protein
MKKLITFIIFLLISSLVYSQNKQENNISEVYKYKSYNGFNYNYALEDENIFLTKYFKINSKYDITEKVYNSINFNIFSDIPGIFKYVDTLFFPENIHFDDGNYIVTEALSSTYNRRFNINIYGLYLVNIRNEYSYFSDIVFPLKINVSERYMILSSECQLDILLNQFGFFYSNLRTSNYNNNYFAYQVKKNLFGDQKKPKFKTNLAYQHLIIFGSLIESRVKTTDYFKSLIDEVSRINKILEKK